MDKTIFNFKGVAIHYNLLNEADVYFLTEDNIYNKEVNKMILDWWYKRLSLNRSDWLVELSLGFEYKWHGVYYRDDRLYEIDRERWENIRNTPILQSNI